MGMFTGGESENEDKEEGGKKGEKEYWAFTEGKGNYRRAE